MNALKVFSVFVGVLFLSGCASMMEPIQIDPSYNRAVVYNHSQYIVQLDGVFNIRLNPGEYASTNVGCYGSFNVIATAYRVKGTQGGDRVLEYYGQRRFTVVIDGKNYVHDELSVDYYYELYSGSFYPSRRGPEYMVAPKVGPCGFVSGSIKFGR